MLNIKITKMHDIVYISDKLSETNFDKLLVILNNLKFNQVYINNCSNTFNFKLIIAA